ncbi:hypothetical protein FQA47_007936 [Oryzias melastigma]|uniref:Secreted protein n=1 Tax=Oryzias melastigma TaxID=30732 RepID=A0A834F745_ORYME|nr:hypothetical protein FQA47_007936 [Oryzias melastigma]
MNSSCGTVVVCVVLTVCKIAQTLSFGSSGFEFISVSDGLERTTLRLRFQREVLSPCLTVSEKIRSSNRFYQTPSSHPLMTPVLRVTSSCCMESKPSNKIQTF